MATSFDAAVLREEFLAARRLAQQQALGDSARSGICRYCGQTWHPFAGSRLDGHAACLVGKSFKLRVGELLRMPTVTYAAVAEVLGVSYGVVRSWAYSAGVAGPVDHLLRRRMR